MKTLVIIPCFNEQASIANTVNELRSLCPDVDYIVVNDCSTDESLHILTENGFSYLNLPVNLGIGGGVQSGYRYALQNHYDIAVQMDGDGQHDPAYLNTILQPILSGEADMCIGSRFILKEGFQTSFMRRFGITIISTLIQLLCGIKIYDVTSGFRACGKDLIGYFANHYASDYPEPEAILSATLSGYKVMEAPVLMRERSGGVSSINVVKSVYYMIKVSLSLIVDRLSFQKAKR